MHSNSNSALSTIESDHYVLFAGSLTLVTDLTSPPFAALHSSLTAMDGNSNRFNIQSGANFSIECVVESPGDFTIQATVDGGVLNTGNGVNVSVLKATSLEPTTTRKTLVIAFDPFLPRTNGVYGCSATSSLTNVTSRKMFLSTGW